MSALDVARAALREVGHDPDSVRLGTIAPDGLRTLTSVVGDEVAASAALLGMLSEFGPHRRVLCRACHRLADYRPPCSALGDVVAGLDCGRA